MSKPKAKPKPWTVVTILRRDISEGNGSCRCSAHLVLRAVKQQLPLNWKSIRVVAYR